VCAEQEQVEIFSRIAQAIERAPTADARPTVWTAAAWWLERRRPKTYALRRDTARALPPMNPEQAREKYRELTGREWGVNDLTDPDVLESLARAARSQKADA
jgi:hypothetical protein